MMMMIYHQCQLKVKKPTTCVDFNLSLSIPLCNHIEKIIAYREKYNQIYII
jgi:hypothetical protein